MKQITITGKTAEMYKQATIVRAILMTHNFDCGITGGFVRDVVFGLEPKDVDIFVPVGTEDTVFANSDAYSKIHALLHEYLPQGEWHHFIYYDGLGDDDRIYGVFQSKVFNLDIILYKTATLTEAVQSCDDYLNMMTIEPTTGDVTYHGSRSVTLPTQSVARKSRVGRAEKMQSKRYAIMDQNQMDRNWLCLLTKQHLETHNIQRES